MYQIDVGWWRLILHLRPPILTIIFTLWGRGVCSRCAVRATLDREGLLGRLDLFIGDARYKVVTLLRILIVAVVDFLGHWRNDSLAILLLEGLKLVDIHDRFAPWLNQLPRALSLYSLVSLPADHVAEIGSQPR